MSILDDAIREHLELKRAHGADDAELKKLEDEAFGPPERPGELDPLAEAPTEFLIAPGAGAEDPGEEAGGRRVPNIADLQEAPEPRQAEEPEAPPVAEPDDGPAVEEQPAMEHEAIADPGHSTEERHAIAEQPTEMFDVDAELAAASDAPSDEELVDAELAEPRLAPAEPLAADAPAEPAAEPAAENEHEDEFDEFFSEQRLSDELNQALEAPLPDEPGSPAAEEDSGEYEVAEGDDTPAEQDEEPAASDSSSHEDVLEDTPEFLEDAPEDDNLWFEQKPPKDFDFDD